MEACKTSDSGVRDWRGEWERGREGERRVREGHKIPLSPLSEDGCVWSGSSGVSA